MLTPRAARNRTSLFVLLSTVAAVLLALPALVASTTPVFADPAQPNADPDNDGGGDDNRDRIAEEDYYAHGDILNPIDANDRFRYVDALCESQRSFVDQGLWTLLDGTYLRQETEKSREPVFSLVYGHFLFVTPPNMPRREEGLKRIRRATELDPDFEYAHYMLGDCYFASFEASRQGQASGNQAEIEKAIASYKRAIDLRDEFSAVHRMLGLALFANDKTSDGEKELERAIDLDPNEADNWLALIEMWNARGRLTDARERINSDTRIPPLVRFYLLGRVFRRLVGEQQYADATEWGEMCLAQAVALGEKLPQMEWMGMYIDLAQTAALKAEPDLPMARGYLDRVFEVMPTNYPALDLLSAIALQFNDGEMALDAINRWTRFLDERPMPYEREQQIREGITRLYQVVPPAQWPRERILYTARDMLEAGAIAEAFTVLQFFLKPAAGTKPAFAPSWFKALDAAELAHDDMDAWALIIKVLARDGLRNTTFSINRNAATYVGMLLRALPDMPRDDLYASFEIAAGAAAVNHTMVDRFNSCVIALTLAGDDSLLAAKIQYGDRIFAALAAQTIAEREPARVVRDYIEKLHESLLFLLNGEVSEDLRKYKFSRVLNAEREKADVYDKWVAHIAAIDEGNGEGDGE